ncbi:hypothetical protein TFLX_05060 [Thermoflexales bacterium]|nr:hypothetical protein TFLX_05060 [Thermoflexales bacterium]
MLCVGLNVALAYWSASTSIRSAQGPVCCSTPAELGLTYENITLTTADGLKLKGWYIPSHNQAAVIALHGYGGNRLGALSYAEMLARHDYGVLLYDQRASGESEGDVLSWGWRDVGDVAAALAFLKTRSDVDPERIGIIGCSTGAEIALGAAAQFDELKAVVADAPYYTVAQDMPPPQHVEEWLTLPMYPLQINLMEWKSGTSAPLALSEAVQRLTPRPVLFIATDRDDFEARTARRYYELAHEPKSIWIISDAYHCTGPQVQPAQYEEHLINFFDGALLR